MIPLKSPDYKDKTAEEILSSRRLFDSAWYTFQSLSWIDYAKRDTNISALQYAALEIRNAIEQFWFETVVLSVGDNLDRKEYVKCKKNTTKMYKILKKLTPDYDKLVIFNRAMFSLIETYKVTAWDLKKINKLYGKVSNFLHFQGSPDETWKKSEWFVDFLNTVENAACYLWNGFTQGATAMSIPENMAPEVREMWNEFKDDQITIDDVKIRLKIAEPVLKDRLFYKRAIEPLVGGGSR